MGICFSRQFIELKEKLERLSNRIELVEKSNSGLVGSVELISDRQYSIDEHINILSDKILNIQLLQEGRSVHNKPQHHTRSFMK